MPSMATFHVLAFFALTAMAHADITDPLADSPPTSASAAGLLPRVVGLLSSMWFEVAIFALASVTYLLTGNAPIIFFRKSMAKDSKAACKAPRTDRRGGAGAAAGNGAEEGSRGLQAQLWKHAKMIISAGKDRNLDGAINVFGNLKESGHPQINSLIYNCMIGACVHSDDLAKALVYFTEAKAVGLADVVSYNTVIKGYLAKGETEAVRFLLLEMSESGLRPTHVAYHCLLNALVQKGELPGTWQVAKHMETAGLVFNSVTCSILLKTITSVSKASELPRLATIMDNLTEPMDEVLFASFVEACIRAGRLDLLSERVEEYARSGGLDNISAPIYGSMIKAYGQARDVNSIWQIWEQMQNRRVIPTAITLGCMVEALVVNQCVEDAWRVLQGVWDDEDQREAVNTIVYSTLLKGFAMSKQHNKVMELYQEMCSRGIPCTTITYNTMINSLARCNLMHKVSHILDDMRKADPPVLPDTVTFSTLVKGYCISGELDRGLELLEHMKKDARLVPDEVTYNSLLEGCARQRRLDDAMRLLEEMRTSGVQPSNYTLSIVLKLLGRAKRLAQAFSMVESVSREYNFKPNIQVYTCLIQACFHNNELRKGLELHDQIIREGCVLDEKIYSVLAKGCLQAREVDTAAEVVRCAYHLPGHRLLQTPGRPKGMDAAVLQEVLNAMGSNSAAVYVLAAEVQNRKAR